MNGRFADVIAQAGAEVRGQLRWQQIPIAYGVVVGMQRLMAWAFYSRFSVSPEEVGFGAYRSALEAAVPVFVLVVVVPSVLWLVLVLSMALSGADAVRHLIRAIRGQIGVAAIYITYWLVLAFVFVGGVVIANTTGRPLWAVIGGVMVAVVFEATGHPPRPTTPPAEPTKSPPARRATWFLPTCAIVIAVLSVLQGWQLYDRAGEVREGRPLRGVPLTAVHAGRATVTALGDPAPAAIAAIANHCMMYLGRSEGVVVLYDVDAQATVRLPASGVIVTEPATQEGCDGD